MNFAKFLGTPFVTARSIERQRETETERERGERDLRLPTETVLQYPTLMRSSRRDHSIDVSDNI